MSKDLSVSEVNGELIAKGFDPSAIRDFAWELVAQDLREPLPSYIKNPGHVGKRTEGLKVRLRRIMEPLMEAGVTPDMIRQATGEVADEIKKRNE